MSRGRRLEPGRTYHVTHRCNHRNFYLKFDIDRDQYIRFLWEGSGKFNVDIYNFIVTSNHVHLMLCSEAKDGISDFMCYMSGSMARYYNRRKQLTGSFWEGRYKSTLIQNGAHFGRCLFYIDLNMVRAGVVKHPREWRWSGHHELIGIRKRYRVLNIENLIRKVSGFDYPHFLKWYTATLDGMLENEVRREAYWTESKCVGDEDFVNGIAGKKERKNISETGDGTFYF